ncbi:META domain-containing protein [Dyadobacter sp. CY343]|uniref:META domain-containing protein n=1 Tax=Dyadobacter sp. CY343 TaxID=2907299 RepID=UPI001F2090A5|nr:META domain-containing protein [Dyadobacter sp. CY343]MCE7062975.1 META domain-containing protein [Dyadobacter sp. CY343]
MSFKYPIALTLTSLTQIGDSNEKCSPVLLILLLVGSTASQCTDANLCCAPQACASDNSLSGKWELDYYLDIATGTTEPNPQKNTRGVIYTFSDDTNRGSIQGHTLNNSVAGSYELAPECNIRILGFGGTKVGEPSWSGRAWLSSAEFYHYELRAMQLTLTPVNGKVRLVFKKVR